MPQKAPVNASNNVPNSGAPAAVAQPMSSAPTNYNAYSKIRNVGQTSVPPDSIPANWAISPIKGKDGYMTARNHITGNEYEGPIKDFNHFLRTGEFPPDE